MVEIKGLNRIVQQYPKNFLIHKIQDTVLDLMYHHVFVSEQSYLFYIVVFVFKNVCWCVRIYRCSTASMTMMVKYFQTENMLKEFG